MKNIQYPHVEQTASYQAPSPLVACGNALQTLYSIPGYSYASVWLPHQQCGAINLFKWRYICFHLVFLGAIKLTVFITGQGCRQIEKTNQLNSDSMSKKTNQGRKATGISILVLSIIITIGMFVDSSKGGRFPGLFFILFLIALFTVSIWLINTAKPLDKNNG